MDRTQRIAELNDQLRTAGLGGATLMTAGVMIGPVLVEDVVAAVRQFDAFTPDNDPYGEHDFGSVVVQGTTYFWKIDYYSPDGDYLSEDPSDPTKTRRVLTIMLAEEY